MRLISIELQLITEASREERTKGGGEEEEMGEECVNRRRKRLLAFPARHAVHHIWTREANTLTRASLSKN